MFHVIMFVLPEDAGALQLAEQAPDMYAALCALRSAFRAHVKYDAPEVTQEVFYQILDDCSVDLDDIP